MMKTILLFVVLCVLFGCAPTSMNNRPTGGAAKKVAPRDFAVVEAVGYGSTRDEALKHAYRNALEKAVGAYVETKIAMQDEELVKDKVLTCSNAYVERYEIVEESKDKDGDVSICIVAVVRKRAPIVGIRGAQKQGSRDIGSVLNNIHAQRISNRIRSVDGAALLENVLGEINVLQQLVMVSLVSSTPEVEEVGVGSGRIRLRYCVEARINKRRYSNEFLPKLKLILGQISVREPESIELYDVSNYAPDKGNRDDGNRANGVYVKRHAYAWSRRGFVYGLDVMCERRGVDSFFLGGSQKLYFTVMEGAQCPGARSQNGLEVVLVTGITPLGLRAHVYSLDAAAAKVIADWQAKVCADSSTYDIVLKNAQNEEIGRGAVFRSGSRALMNTGFVRDNGALRGGNGSSVWFVSPYIRGCAEIFQKYLWLELPESEMPKISSATFEYVE